MGINIGSVYERFEREQAKLRKDYIREGMNDEQIRAMYEFDKSQMNRDLAYHRRSVSIEECLEKDEKRDDLSKKIPFLSQLTYEIEELQSGEYWWIDQITDERICSILKTLSNEELEIIDLYVFVGYNQAEIAKRTGVSQATVSRKINEVFDRIRKTV